MNIKLLVEMFRNVYLWRSVEKNLRKHTPVAGCEC